MQKSENISIIIVNYKSEVHLNHCVDSILNKLKNHPFEIIIVNNNEKKEISFNLSGLSNVQVVENKKNLGFGRAANLGAKKAQNKWLLFLNPDTKIITNMSKMLLFLKQNEDIDIASPKLLDENGNIQLWSTGKKLGLKRLMFDNIKKLKTKRTNQKETAKEVDWVSGAAMFIKRETFEGLGGFDEKMFMYFEDVDICKRAKDTGKKIIYFPDEIVEHLGGKSIESKEKQKEDYYKSQDYYFQKHHGKMQAKIVKYLRKLIV